MEVYTDLETRSNKSELYGWVWQYNPFKSVYEAAKREFVTELWNGDKGNIIRATTQSALEEVIIKTGGDKELLKNLTQ